ncbi:MAG: tetratricopeptide repeat protein [Terriglobia bacterium]
MAHLTRKELKKDPFLSIYYDDFVDFAEKHYRELAAALVIIALLVVGVISWNRHAQAQEASANALLGSALAAFHAYVGSASADALGPGIQRFSTTDEKYQASLKGFSAVAAKYPHQKAGEIALYHAGICQAMLGQQTAAVKTLQRAGKSSDPEIASLSRLALADELEQTGKLVQAEEIYNSLAQHPTRTVPAATAWLALADAEAPANPSQARQIYERVSNEMSSDAFLTETLKQKLADLTRRPGE